MPHQPFSAWVDRWHSMTIAISGPKSNHTGLGTGDGERSRNLDRSFCALM